MTDALFEDTEGVAAGPPSGSPNIGRSMLAISGWNALSRLTGFVRVLAIGAALGTTYLGNTYQGANLISNLLFELLAAGLLSAPLVPAFVRLLREGRPGEAERLAGNLLGVSLLALGLVVVVAGLLGGHVMRLLTSGVQDASIRSQEIRLGRFLLWFFLPQVLLYATGSIASALLHARGRFAAAAAAPVANNVVVIATMGLVAAERGAGPPLLALDTTGRLLLALGTTGGVLAMSLVPVVAAQRAGFRVRPLVALSDPALRSVARVGAWGGLLLAGAQLLIGTTLLLSNRVQGGVVAYQIAFTFFLLPFALIAHPVFTALYPRMAASAHEERWEQFAAEVRDGSTRLATFLLPASGLLIALAHPGLRAVHVGALDEHGAALIADVLVPYAAGLLSYGAFHLLARAWTAAAAPRVPAVVGLAASAAGAVAMWLMAGAGAGDARVTRLGWAHSAAMTAAAAALLVLLRRRIGHGLLLTASLVRGLIAGAAAWSAAAAAVRVFDGPGRLAAVTATVFGGLAGVAAAGAVVAVLRAARRAHAVTS